MKPRGCLPQEGERAGRTLGDPVSRCSLSLRGPYVGSPGAGSLPCSHTDLLGAGLGGDRKSNV